MLGVHGGSMQVVYQNNIDDLVALNADLMANNEQFMQRKNWNLYGAPSALLIVFSFYAYFMDKPGLYGGAVIGSIVSYLWTYFSYKNYPKKVAKKLQLKEVYCEHTVTITAEGIREATTNSESYHK
jgi:Na+/proline symporter